MYYVLPIREYLVLQSKQSTCQIKFNIPFKGLSINDVKYICIHFKNELTTNILDLYKIVFLNIWMICALQMFTRIYEYFIGKSRCGDFKFMGIACYPQFLQKSAAKWKKKNSVLFKSFFKFSNNFCGDFRLPVIPVKMLCMLRGTPCNTRISYTFYREKLWSVS